MYDEMTEQEKEAKVFGIHNNELAPWDPEQAKKIAGSMDIDLTDAHYEVLRFLRAVYEENNSVKHARTLTQALDEKFESKGGLKYLYTLFPNGPVSQGCRIAGVPLPGDSQDQSFGTAY